MNIEYINIKIFESKFYVCELHEKEEISMLYQREIYIYFFYFYIFKNLYKIYYI
jgi:hypothetical protein